MARILLILSLSTLLAVALLVAVLLWGRLDSAEIGLHGALAMGLGAVLSLGLGGGLLALVFYSARRGYDDSQHGSLGALPPEDWR